MGRMTDAELQIREMQATVSDLDLFKACFDASGTPRDREQLRWQYLENPHRQLFVDFAISNEGGEQRVASIYATNPVMAKLGDCRRLAAQSLDTLTLASYRGRGLFKTLAIGVFEHLEQEEVAFIYGFPNADSAHGFFNRLGWVSLDPIPHLIRPLKLRYLLRRARLPERILRLVPEVPFPHRRPIRLEPGWEIHPVTEFDARFDQLWERFAREVRIAVCREAAYLTWRLARKPGAKYRTLGLYERDQLHGFVSYSFRTSEAGRIGHIMELIYAPGEHRIGRSLLSLAASELTSAGADVIHAWNFEHSPNHAAYRSSLFLPLPRRLRSEKLFMGVRALYASDVKALGDRRNWYVSFCDSDTV